MSSFPTVRRILLIKPSALGDVIHTLPLLKALRKHFPEARISWVIKEDLRNLLEGNPYLERTFPFDGRVWKNPTSTRRIVQNFSRLIREIQRERFDLALDLQGLFRSGLIAYLSGAACRAGFARARELSPIFYNLKVPGPQMELHAIDRYQRFLSHLGIEATEIDFPIAFTDADRGHARSLLKAGAHGKRIRRWVFLNPGATWESKRWPTERFARLGDELQKRYDVRVALIGGPGDIPLAEEIESRMASAPLVLAGKTTLRQLAALFREGTLLITNDSGPMHMAVAMGTPVLALFGPTSPNRTGPYGKGHRVLQRKELSCVPCFKKRCPEGGECLRDIETEEVLEAAGAFL